MALSLVQRLFRVAPMVASLFVPTSLRAALWSSMPGSDLGSRQDPAPDRSWRTGPLSSVAITEEEAVSGA